MYDLIMRCMKLLMYLDEEECAHHLDGFGEDPGKAFLAIKAAGILIDDWEKKYDNGG